MKRVLIVCKGHKNIAGAQLYLAHISSIFPPQKYEIHFAVHKADGLRVFEEISKTSTVILWEYDWRHMPFFKSIICAIKLFKKIAPNLIIFNSSEDEVLAPTWAAWFIGIRNRIMIVHWAQSANSLPLFSKKISFFPVPSRYAIKTRIKRGLAYSLLNKMIFVNNCTRLAYMKLYNLNSNRCKTIYNGVDAERFSRKNNGRASIRQQLGVAPRTCMILATGNLTAVKGHRFLVDAVKQLISNGVQVKCFIAGHGELQAQLEGQIASHRLENHVTLLGYRNDVNEILCGTDIFCMPSLNEALGYSILEALSVGVPVVASDVGGIPEVITHGKEGFLVEPGQATQLATTIHKLWLQPELRQRMGQNGINTILEKFSISNMRRETKKFILV